MTTEDEPHREALPWRPAAVGFVVFLAAAASVAYFGVRLRIAPVDQPIAFNHRKHVVENEIDCSTCHLYYETETFSGLPTTEVCSSCHSEAIGTSAEEQQIVKLVQKGDPIEWQPLFRQPSHIFYSHRRHVAVAKLGCESCHGAIAKSERPPRRVERLTMNDCIECHKRRGVAADCTTCHR